jgi:phosphate transport system substrate-binding protein
MALGAASLAIAGCGSTPRRPPPAAASPAPGSIVIHALGDGYAGSVYQEAGSLLSREGITLNYQLSRGGSLPAHLRHRGVDVVAAESTQPLAGLDHARGSSEMYVPIGFGAAAVIYDIPGVRSLQLRGGVLASIFLGRITRWNNRSIRHDNPGVVLPATPITVVHRSDSATVSDLFTQYLSASSRRWRRGPGAGPALSWPAGTAVSGDDSMRQIVSQNPGAIGYTDQASAFQDKLRSARLRNAAGHFVGLGLRSISAVGSRGTSLSVPTIGARSPGAYPIAAEAYVVTFHDPCDAGLRTGASRALQRSLSYLVGPGQSVVRRLSFAPLPGRLRRAAAREIRRMQCGGMGL